MESLQLTYNIITAVRLVTKIYNQVICNLIKFILQRNESWNSLCTQMKTVFLVETLIVFGSSSFLKLQVTFLFVVYY